MKFISETLILKNIYSFKTVGDKTKTKTKNGKSNVLLK